MAACELRGELKYRDGETKEFVIKAENNLKSILAGVQKMSKDASEVLTELVLQEKGSVGNDKGVDDEEEEESDEEDDEIKTKNGTKASSTEPPAKRTKTVKS
ncbi:hypothetical protein JZ751_010557 [Albula glossodonta]|uniref:Uncharacterized protein n=1 Tax=Albula glossodonta TaxID=121402 RepID=A0A8T2NZE1_9TELE|nr:hypothetical protein JZ751_010557 [Albula glossodonta]